MNKYIFVLLLIFMFISCDNDGNKRVKIYSLEDFNTKIKFVDTACINAVAKAKSDIKNGKASYNKEHVYAKSFIDATALNKICQSIGFSLDTVTVPQNYDPKTQSATLFSPDCYQMEMRQYIINKYDSDTINSIITSAERKYIQSHPNKIYSMRDIDKYYDGPSARDFNDILEKIRLAYTYDFIYPEDYVFDSKKTSETIISFVALKDGGVKDLSFKSTFQKNYNNQFTKHFHEKLREIINKQQWTAPYCSGLPVNMKIEMIFKHK